MKPIIYGTEPANAKEFTTSFDQFYSSFAKVYALFIHLFPVWKKWISGVLPFIKGKQVLEISFGTAALLPLYAAKYNTYAIDYNAKFVKLASQKLKGISPPVNFQQADVEKMPYADESFDCIINTMAFTGYPNGQKALMEMRRILKPDGLLLMVDIDYPNNKNRIGVMLTRFWLLMGDLIRDMHSLFDECEFAFQDIEIGGYGSVHLYIVRKK